jgi:predicted transcriptional regulator
MTATTTICLDPKIKEMLKNLKKHPEESYNSVVERLVNMAVDPEPLSEETIKRIEDGLKDIKKGMYYTEEQVAAELGIRED